MFKHGIRGFIEEEYRNKKSLEEIENDLIAEYSKAYRILNNKNSYELYYIMKLIKFLEFEIYYELYQFELLKKCNLLVLEKYFLKAISNYLSALKFGGYKVSNELKHEILEYARKNHFLQAIFDLIDEIYGPSTIYQKIMYAIDGVYYDKSEAFNRYELLQDSQFEGGTPVAQKQK